MPWWGIVLIVIGVLIVAFIVFAMTFGKKMQKKQAEAEKQMEMNKQTVTMLIIDKQMKKMTESGLSEAIIQQAPKIQRRMKLPVVKAKIGPRVMILIADKAVFEILPVKKTVTVTVSGIYITELKAIRGGTVPKLQAKKKWYEKLKEKATAGAKGK